MMCVILTPSGVRSKCLMCVGATVDRGVETRVPGGGFGEAQGNSGDTDESSHRWRVRPETEEWMKHRRIR